MENKQQSEIAAVQNLLELLDFKGVVFTIDVLYCQKKSLPQSSKLAMILMIIPLLSDSENFYNL